MAGAISLMDYQVQTQDGLRRGLVQKITNASVFIPMLRFIPVPTLAYSYGEQATLGGIGFRGLNQDYDPDTGIVNPKIEKLAILGGQINTDRQLAGANPNDPRASAIAAKAKKAGLFFDKNVIDGNSAADNRQFDGLNRRLVGKQVIAAGDNGGTLTLGMIDDLIDRVAGPNERKHLVLNKAIRRKMKSLVLAEAGGAALMDVGKSLPSYDNVTIDVIDEDGDEAPILDFDEVQGSSAVTTSIYCVIPGEDPEGEYMQGLVKNSNTGATKIGDMSLIDLIQNTQIGTKIIDVLEAVLGIALFHGRAAARLKGLTNT